MYYRVYMSQIYIVKSHCLYADMYNYRHNVLLLSLFTLCTEVMNDLLKWMSHFGEV